MVPVVSYPFLFQPHQFIATDRPVRRSRVRPGTIERLAFLISLSSTADRSIFANHPASSVESRVYIVVFCQMGQGWNLARDRRFTCPA